MKRFWDNLFISHGKCYGRSNILPQSGRDSLIVFILFIYLVCAHESLQDAFGSDNEANFQASLKFSWRAKDYILGYYTVARGYEFYFRVAKQYFTNERSE